MDCSGGGAPVSALVLTAEHVAEAMGWMSRSEPASPRRDKVRAMVRQGRFPKPIDDAEPVHMWRWSRAVVEAYVDGTWTPDGR